jgi:pyridoxamine 5'-phosphate oxidase
MKKKAIESIRSEYTFAGLNEKDLEKNPFLQFEKWLTQAIEFPVKEPLAMAVGTIGTNGFPQSRIVLLRHYSTEGFVFYTNYNSVKGKSIAQNPKVSLHFFWPDLERQVRIVGIAGKIPVHESAKYFQSRPVNSQVAAVISEQSAVIPSRNYLENRFDEFTLKNKKPVCPDYWGGYLVKSRYFEFWQGRESRLHDRLVYEEENNNWLVKRLAP